MDRQIRVRHLVRTLDLGGLEMVVLDLARHRNAQRFDVGVICLGAPGALAPRFEAHGIPVHSLRATGLTASLIALVRHLYGVRPDVLHTHNPSPHLLGSVAARIARVPVVVHTKHGRNRPEDRRAVLMNRWASRLTNRIVAVSHDAADVAMRIEGVPTHRVVVIHNGVDLARFPARPPREVGARAVCVARLDAVKDHATLLHAARRVANKRPDFKLDLVGDGPERSRLEDLRRSLELTAHVHFQGEQSDIRSFLAAARVFVLSSVSEGIALTILEAMASAVPVVATDVGGNRELVLNGFTGRLVPPQAPGALADALLELVSDPTVAAAMGQASRKRAEEDFDLRRTVALYEEHYTDLLHASSR